MTSIINTIKKLFFYKEKVSQNSVQSSDQLRSELWRKNYLTKLTHTRLFDKTVKMTREGACRCC